MILINIRQKKILDEAADFTLDHHYLFLTVLHHPLGGLPDFELQILQDSKPPREVGFMHFGPHAKVKDIWHVKNVLSNPGFGPALYECAMELSQAAGAKGLAPDPSSITEPARAVWKKYNARDNVSKQPLDPKFKVRPDVENPRAPELFQVFSKTKPDFVKYLLANNKLRDRNSELKRFFPSVFKSES